MSIKKEAMRPKESKPKLPIKLIETAYFNDGTEKVDEKQFPSKQILIKAMTQSPIPSKIIYELKKFGEASFVHTDGIKRHLKIVS